jgi:hypothetical protein
LKGVELILVEHMDEVLKQALLVDDSEDLFKKPIEQEEEVLVPTETPEPSGEITAH